MNNRYQRRQPKVSHVGHMNPPSTNTRQQVFMVSTPSSTLGVLNSGRGSRPGFFSLLDDVA
ncbi:hypothetical protein CW304_32960 [Bacillus sp. UFRGS-B20]|nr:hypothetical protein CW304_32960 [Bacillus sp. UFRGS-B20]